MSLSPDRKKAACEHLCRAVSIPTVSAPEAPDSLQKFTEFHHFLEEAYPLVHRVLTREIVLERALLYHWRGTGKSTRKPFAILGHLDVVPVEDGTEDDWKYPPFSGKLDDLYIYGRGSSDMKNQVIAIFEAVECLLSQGLEPDRDIYLCFGHNEEILVGEGSGAREIADVLQSRGVRLDFVLDEGGAVLEGSLLGIRGSFATIGIAEKGYCDLKITVDGPGGHAAEPPPDTAVLQLAVLLSAMRPLKPKLTDTVVQTVRGLGTEKSGLVGFLLRHPKLLYPFLKKKAMKIPMVAAMLHTTWVATMLRAGSQANVLPQSAEAVVNARILPGETDRTLVEMVQKTAARRGISCRVEVLRYSPPPTSGTMGTQAYGLLARLVREIHGAVPIPYLVTGATDSREYREVADEILRFYPFAVTFEELAGMHGTDERVRVESFAQAICFMEAFIKDAGGIL